MRVRATCGSPTEREARGWGVGCEETCLRQGIPPLPEVRVCNDADSLTELALDSWWTGYHKANKLLFYRRDLVNGQFVVSIFVLRGDQQERKACELGRSSDEPRSCYG